MFFHPMNPWTWFQFPSNDTTPVQTGLINVLYLQSPCNSNPSPHDIARFLENIDSLKHSNSSAFNDAIDQLRQFVAERS